MPRRIRVAPLDTNLDQLEEEVFERCDHEKYKNISIENFNSNKTLISCQINSKIDAKQLAIWHWDWSLIPLSPDDNFRWANLKTRDDRGRDG